MFRNSWRFYFYKYWEAFKMFIQSSVVVECLRLFSSGSCPGCYWRLYGPNISIQIFRKGLREKGKVLIYWETSLLRDGVGYFVGVFWWVQAKGGRLRQNYPFKLTILSNPWILFLPSHTIHLTKQKEPPPKPVFPHDLTFQSIWGTLLGLLPLCTDPWIPWLETLPWS